MAARRIGWMTLAAVSALVAVASLLGGAWQVGLAAADGSVFDITAPLFGAAVSVVFWRWIGLGAWERAHPARDPETGALLAPSGPIGPWGWIGRALLALIVVAVLGIGTWGTIETRRQGRETSRIQAQLQRAARTAQLTVGQVEAASRAHEAWLATGSGGDDPSTDPLADLLSVPGTEVQDVEVVDGNAAILIRPSRGLPCIVVDLRPSGAITSRATEAC